MNLSEILPYVGVVYAIVSVGALFLYAWDKYCAMRGVRRVPERTLHVVALLGGWPGAWLAQGLFRHKSVKTSFRIVFWLTVILNTSAVTGGVWLLLKK